MCALPLPVELIVRAGKEANKSGSPEVLSRPLAAVFAPVEVINPMVPPVAFDECECDGISPVLNT